jgi:hypothetical protein
MLDHAGREFCCVLRGMLQEIETRIEMANQTLQWTAGERVGFNRTLSARRH